MKIEERRTRASRRISGRRTARQTISPQRLPPRQPGEKMGTAAKFIPPHRIIFISAPCDGAAIRRRTSIFVTNIDRINTQKIFSLVIFLKADTIGKKISIEGNIVRFSNLYNASHSGGSRRYDSETGRGRQTAEPSHSRESSPPQSPELSGALEGLSNLQINRPRSNMQPNTQRRGLASRISSVFGASKRPAPGPVSQTVETTVRIDRARGPQQESTTPEAEVRAHMMNALAQLQQGEALSTVVRSLPLDVSLYFSIGRCALTNDGRTLVEDSYGSHVLQAFDNALALPSASRRPDISAKIKESKRARQRSSGPSASEVRDHMMDVCAKLRQGHQLQQLVHALPDYYIRYFNLNTTALSDEGRELVATYGPNVLANFEEALGLLSASRRAYESEGRGSQHRAGVYRPAQRTRLSGQSENAAQPRARTSPARAEAPATHAMPSTSATPAQTLINGGFVKASTAFLQPNASMADVAASAGVSEEALRVFLTEDGITPKGSELLSQCNLTAQAAVCWNVHLGTSRRAEARAHAAQPASPVRTASPVQPASPTSTEQTPTESPRSSGLPGSQWSGWDESTPVRDVMGPPAYPPPAYPSTPNWEVVGSPGPALSADSSLLGSQQWPTDLNTHGQEVMWPPTYPQSAYPSTPHWEVTGSPGPALSADSSLLGSQQWPTDLNTHGQEVMWPPAYMQPAYPQPAYPSTPSWEVTGSPGPALSADSSLLGSHFAQWPAPPGTPGQDVMGPPGSPLPADSNTTFGNLSSIASYRSRDTAQIDLNADADEDADEVEVTGPEAFAQPAASDTTFRSLGSLGASTMPYGGSYGYGYDPYAATPSHWPQQASPAHEQGLALSHLPTGLLAGVTRESFLTQVNAEMGYASAQGLNCLLDSLLQLVHGSRRWLNYEPPGIAQEVAALRRSLVVSGEADRHGHIDAEGANLLAVTLAANYGVRIQFIEEDEDQALAVHPVYGNHGPLLHILHTPGHFQPLWPKN